MAISVGNTANSGVLSSTSSTSFSLDNNKEDVIVLVAIRDAETAATVSGVTYNSVSMTQDVTHLQEDNNSANDLRTYIFRLLNAATGSNTVAVTFSSTVDHAAVYAVAVGGLNDTGQPDATASGGENYTVPTDTVIDNQITTVAADTIIFEVVYSKQQEDLTIGASRTSLGQIGVNGGGDRALASYRIVSSQNTYTLDWSYGGILSGGADDYSQSIVAYKATAGTPSNSTRAAKVTGKTSTSSTRGARVTGLGSGGNMPFVANSYSTFGDFETAPTLDVSITGSNRGLLIFTFNENSPVRSVLSVNMGATPLTYLTGRTRSADRIEVWYIADPAQGDFTVTVNFDAEATGYSLIGVVVNDADTSDFINVFEEADGSSSAPTINIITTDDDVLLIDGVLGFESAEGLTNDGSQTLIQNAQNLGFLNAASSYKEVATASAETMDWVATATEEWILVAVGINPTTSSVSVPTVATVGATDTKAKQITVQGNITATGGASVTKRGFEINQAPYSGDQTFEQDTYSTGFYTLDIMSLLPNTTYYVRAFAENSEGFGFGEWVTVTTDESGYSIIIDGEDRTADALTGTIRISDIINDKQNTCVLNLVDLSEQGMPELDEEIIITNIDGVRVFAGYVVEVSLDKRGYGEVMARIQAIDYARLLDRNLVHRSFENMTDKEIIEEIISVYCAGSGITTTNVLEGVTIDQISFNYVQVSQAFRKIADLTGRNWFIDYEKDIHYFPLTTTTAPFDIDSANDEYFDLKLSKDATQIKNRVYVRGGTKLSDEVTYSVKGDGVMKQFVLPDKPHDVSVTVNAGSESLGIKNIDTSGYDWYLNFQEKYIEQDAGNAVLTTSDTLTVSYKYDIPILVALENPSSIAEHGVQEFAIFDKEISTTQSARDRASAELTDYAAKVIEGSFSTYTTGFVSGQYININLSDFEINDDYIIQSVSAQSLGGGEFIFNVNIASAKTMGIIRFLIELLEANRNIITLDDNEVVDELFNITDALLSDSLVENLTIDSAGVYRTWCSDSLQSSPITRAIWNLFEWR